MALRLTGAWELITKVLTIGQQPPAAVVELRAVGDVIEAFVDGTLVEARVVKVLADGRLAIQYCPGVYPRHAVIDRGSVAAVIAHEPLQRGAQVWVTRYGRSFEALVWSVWGSEIELTSGVILAYCHCRLMGGYDGE